MTDFDLSTHCSYEVRRKHIKRKCKDIYGKQDNALDRSYDEHIKDYVKNIYVNDKHKLLLCVPFKSGSSTFLKLLASNSDAKFQESERNDALTNLYKRSNRLKFNISNLDMFKASDIESRLRSYTKVIVVRQPLVRVLSMYMDKIRRINRSTNEQCGDRYQRNLGRKILFEQRRKLSLRDWQCSNSVTFHEFLRYFAAHTKQMTANVHLTTIEKWCSPCYIDYDLILKLETAQTDLEYLVDLKGLSKAFRTLHENKALFKVNETPKNMNFTDRTLKHYSGIDTGVLNNILEIYEDDMNLFGYSAELKPMGLEAQCETILNKTSSCC